MATARLLQVTYPASCLRFRGAVNDMGLGSVQNVCFDVWSVVMSTEDCDRMQ